MKYIKSFFLPRRFRDLVFNVISLIVILFFCAFIEIPDSVGNFLVALFMGLTLVMFVAYIGFLLKR